MPIRRSLPGAVCACLLVLALLSSACGRDAGTGKDFGEVIVSDPLVMQQLSRERRYRVYLPPGYAASHKRYPVLYVHDGQNLFDEATAYADEWQVDETLDRQAEEGGPEIIVVGIDNGEAHRLNEMAPWQHQRYGDPQADEYLAFIVEQVKPAVDEAFRTQPGREHTGILGSSMGGLVSHYAAFRYPSTFSKVGALSPSYWWSDGIFELTKEAHARPDTQFFLLVGGGEETSIIESASRMHTTLREAGYDRVTLRRISGAQHNEDLWRVGFEEAVSMLFGNGTGG